MDDDELLSLTADAADRFIGYVEVLEGEQIREDREELKRLIKKKAEDLIESLNIVLETL